MKASLQTISTLVMEDISIESNMRKRERPSSPLTNTGGAPTKRAFRRLDSDCAADCEAFIPSEEEECPHIRVRKAMLAQIEERLDPNEPRRLCLAKKLEALLFHNAPCFDVYADESTIDSRIRLAAIALVSRQRLRKAQEKKDQRQALMKALGEEMYHQVCDTVRAVQDLRLRGAASCRCITTCCQKKIHIPGQRAMPPPVRNLFFETKLIEAAENTPLDKISSVDWEYMVMEAQENMKAFQKWSGLPKTE